MTIQIDWSGSSSTPGGIAYEIYVPKADLTLIQSNPTEIRELDLDWFRYQLHDLQDDPDGRPWPRTHSHNTEVTLGGLTFARVVEIIAPYSITFEDGQYAVNIVGGNSNVLDVTNRNQVSVAPNNSAGLISTPLIEVAAFENGVTIDANNITGRAVAGTIGLIGTYQLPSNNLADAKLIDNFRGFGRYYVIGDLDLDTAEDFSRNEFVGRSHVNNELTIQSLPNVQNATFRELHVKGTLDGGNGIDNCVVEDLVYVNGHIHMSGLIGTISLAGAANAVLTDCKTVDPFDPPEIDMGGSGQNLAMPNYSGLLTISNLASVNNFAGVGLLGGQVVLADDVTAGTVHVSGTGTLLDSAGNHIVSQTGWNGNVTIINETVSATELTYSVWDTVHIDTSLGTPGTTFPQGTDRSPVNNWADAKAIAQAPENNISKIEVRGDLTFTSSAEGFSICGLNPARSIIRFNGQSVAGSNFIDVDIRGPGTGKFFATNCELLNGYSSGLDCQWENCQLNGEFVAAMGGAVKGDRCTSPFGTTFNMNVVSGLSMANFSGVATIANANHASAQVGFTGTALLTLADTLVQGAAPYSAILGGSGLVTDLSQAGFTVLNKVTPRATWMEQEADHDTEGCMGYALGITRMMQVNGLELESGQTNNWVLRDDAGAVKLRFNVTDENGDPISLPSGYPALRSKGVTP